MSTQITFEKLPETVEILLNEVLKIRDLIEMERIPEKKRTPIEIEDACRILKKAKATIYTLVRKGKLPSYKNGKKLYFFEDELLDWIIKGKKKTIDEIHSEIESENVSVWKKSKKKHY